MTDRLPSRHGAGRAFPPKCWSKLMIKHLRSLGVAVLCIGPASAAMAQAAARPLNRANLDTTCAACSDFYQFANGGWLKRNTIPPDKSSLGSFGILGDKNQEVVQKIVIDDALL